MEQHTRKCGKIQKHLKLLPIFQFFKFAKLFLVFTSSYRYVNRGDILYLCIENN